MRGQRDELGDRGVEPQRGEVVALYVGELREPQAALILSVVQDLNQERIQLKEARRTIAEGLQKLRPSKSG